MTLLIKSNSRLIFSSAAMRRARSADFQTRRAGRCRRSGRKIILHLPLGGEFGFQRIVSAAGRQQKFAPNRLRLAAENFLQHRVVDERLGHPLAVEVNPARGKFARLQRQRRHEIAENALDRVRRTAPDAEKSENMVNAKRVEITPHLRKPPLPPGEAVGGHARPVVSGKAPVLALGGKRIRRRARLHVQMVQLRRLPGVRAMPIDADGNVALQNQAGGVDVGGGVLELQMQMILHEIMERDRPHGAAAACRRSRPVWPMTSSLIFPPGEPGSVGGA